MGLGIVSLSAATRGEILLPAGLDNGIFMGITDLIASSTSQYLSFNLTYGLLSNGSYGIILDPSTPPGSPITNIRFMYFYVQKMITTPSPYVVTYS